MIARPKRSGLLSRVDVGSAFEVPGYARAADLWDAWRFAAVESALALKDWMIAGPEEKEIGYDAYLACLDREEQAAIALAERVDPDGASPLRARL
jgi:hypothetical protein